jgi:16S rRNA pseudouridine516 synthase
MQLQDILYSQGFGTRRICAGLIQQGYVQVDFGDGLANCDDALEDVAVHEGLHYSVQGVLWPYHAKAYVLLHKPAGYECSHKPSAWPSMYTLLPPPLRYRPQKSAVQGVQAVGRLDQDTTGMLVLTDDGSLIHRMSSPRHHVPKVYEVSTAEPISDKQVLRLLEGVVLDDSPKPVKAAACLAVSQKHMRLTLTEGKYHQVKRMLIAVGNSVAGLHRSQIGAMELPQDLAPGQWRWITPDELQALSAKNAVT